MLFPLVDLDCRVQQRMQMAFSFEIFLNKKFAEDIATMSRHMQNNS
jgi:hypothetical protein